jgi:hypothetical protein
MIGEGIAPPTATPEPDVSLLRQAQDTAPRFSSAGTGRGGGSGAAGGLTIGTLMNTSTDSEKER